MKNINNLCLLVFLRPLILPHIIIIVSILGWPVFKLEMFSWGEKAHNSCPLTFREALHAIKYLKCYVYTFLWATDSFNKCFFVLKLFILIFYDIFGPHIMAISEQLDCIFKAYVSWVVRGRNNNYWSALLIIYIEIVHKNNLTHLSHI